jgi:hypothetical protein
MKNFVIYAAHIMIWWSNQGSCIRLDIWLRCGTTKAHRLRCGTTKAHRILLGKFLVK